MSDIPYVGPLTADTLAIVPFLVPGTPNARTLGADILDGVNILRCGQPGVNYGNGTTDDGPLFQAAATFSRQNGGRPVYIGPAPGGFWRLASAVTDTGGANLVCIGNCVILNDVSGTLWTVSGPNSRYQNFRFLGQALNNSNFMFLIQEGADYGYYGNMYYSNGGSFIRNYGDYGIFDGLQGAQLRGTLLRLDGTANNNKIYDYGGPNIQTGISFDSDANAGAGTGPYSNRLLRGKKWVVAADLTAYQQTQTGNVLFPNKPVYNAQGQLVTTYGGDIVSMTSEAHDNNIEDIETIASRDGSGTINGNDNRIDGFRATTGLGSGLGLFGNYNHATDLYASYMNQGVVSYSAFGGYGSYNTVKSGHVWKCRKYGVVSARVGIRVWIPNQAYSSVARYTAVWDPALEVWNSYGSSQGTNHFGNIRMTFQSGSGTDGSLDPNGNPTVWNYISTSKSIVPFGNNYFGITSEQNGIEEYVGDLAGYADWSNSDQGRNFRYGCPNYPDGQIQDATMPMNNAIGGETTLFIRIDAGDTDVTAPLTTDGLPPSAHNQLIVGNTQAGRIVGSLIIKDNNSQAYYAWDYSATFRRSALANPPTLAVSTMTQVGGVSVGTPNWIGSMVPVWNIDADNFALQILLTCPLAKGISARARFRSVVEIEEEIVDTDEPD